MAKKDEPKLVGITAKKSEDFSEWYNQVVLKAKLADFTSVKGFMAVRPNAYEIWEKIQDYFNKRIKATGHRNAYFPAVIPESFLRKEKEHVAGFSPEVFWISSGGTEELEEKLALRPTSETIIYDSYSKWIQSYRDLPMLMNVWCSVFRCETKMTKLFLRTREFLWQEGHTAHATKQEADKEMFSILETYKNLMEELLAIPVLPGTKTDKEKFAGALVTTTLEALMPDGRALQMGTSHNLGQHFSMPFKIKFLDKDKTEKYAWNTSWGFSTRLIGALIMMHGDDKGLVMPPRVAPTQVVIVPIIFEKSKEKVLKKAKEITKNLGKNFSVILDARDNYSAGWKFNHWELLGIPIRIEIGPEDIKKDKAIVVRRDTGKKDGIKTKDLEKNVKELLETIQADMFKKETKFLKANIREAKTYQEFKSIIEKNKGFIKTTWCGNTECEDKIQEDTTATIRLIPLKEEKPKGKCVYCGKEAKQTVYFAKSY
jgi:prolyl-tRNA synthetase